MRWTLHTPEAVLVSPCLSRPRGGPCGPAAAVLFVVGLAFAPSSSWAEGGGDGQVDGTDACYFVIVDRFFNGDPRNDDQGFGEFNPSRAGFYHGGDWAGLSRQLPYIAGMGFTCLYISPVVDNWKGSYVPQDRTEPFTSYHGYHAYDLTRPNLNFGTWAELRGLVDAAHGLGLDVMVDQVFNHLSPKEVLPLWAYPGFGPEDFHACVSGCDVETGALANLADLATGKVSVRQRLAEGHAGYFNAIGADAIRLDTVKHIAASEWGDLTARLRALIPGERRDRMFGEVFVLDGSDEELATAIGRYTFPPANLDGVLNFLFYRAVRDLRATGAGRLGSVRHWQLAAGKFADPYALGNFIDNHDVPRFLCEHDNSWDQLKQALDLAYTWPGLPFVYYGTEQGSRGCRDPENREDMWTLGARPFDTSGDLYVHLRRLNAVRSSANIPGLTFTDGGAGAALRRGRVFDERWVDGCLYGFERSTVDGAARALVLLNACGGSREMAGLQTGLAPGTHREVTYGTRWLEVGAGGRVASIWLAPYETLIFER